MCERAESSRWFPLSRLFAGPAEAMRLSNVLDETFALGHIGLDSIGGRAFAIERQQQGIGLLLRIAILELTVRDCLDHECITLAIGILGAAIGRFGFANRGLVLAERQLL